MCHSSAGHISVTRRPCRSEERGSSSHAAQNADLSPEINALAANDPDNLKIKGPVLIEQGLADTTVIPSFDQQLGKG
ncbi:MAG: hypothetical protein ACXVFO_03150 [Solirubrobacteraceae bacterium]